MRNKKIQGQGLFDVTNERRNHVSKAKENGKRSPLKKISPKGKRKLSFPKKIPGLLNGKRFFLDLHGYGKENFAKDIIEQLGGILEEFNSKEVYCIITNRFTVDEINTHRAETRRSTPSPMQGPVPSPLMPVPSPLQQISSNKCAVNSPLSTDSPQTPQSLDPKAPHITRGKSLQLKAVTSTQKQGSSNLLQLAKKWGTKVMHINQFLSWSREKKVAEILQLKSAHRGKSGPSSSHGKSSTTRVKNLKTPFIRIEDESRNYRPVFAELDEWPTIHFESGGGSCPFEKPKERNTLTEPNEQISDKETNKDDSLQTMSEKASEKQPDRPVEKKEDVKGGYCECCSVRFDDMSKHLKSDQHRAFAKNDVNYAALDSVIKKGSTFDDFLADVCKKYQSGTDENGNSERSSSYVDVKDEVFQTANEQVSLQRKINCEEGEEKHQAEFLEEKKTRVEQTEEEVFHSNASKNMLKDLVKDSKVGNVEVSEREQKQDLDIQTHDDAEFQEEEKIQVDQTEEEMFHSKVNKNINKNLVNEAKVGNAEVIKRGSIQDLDMQTHDDAPNCKKVEVNGYEERQSCSLKPQDDDVQRNELVEIDACGTAAYEVSPNENIGTKLTGSKVDEKGVPTKTNIEVERENALEELKVDNKSTSTKDEDHTEFSVKPVEALEIRRETCVENVDRSRTAVFKGDNQPASVRDEVSTGFITKHEESVEMVVEKCPENVDKSRTTVFKDDNQPASVRDEISTGFITKHVESVEMVVENNLEKCQNSTTIDHKLDNLAITDDKATENQDVAIFGEVEEPISAVSDDTGVLQKRKESTPLNKDQGTEYKAVRGDVGKPFNDVSEDNVDVPERKQSARLTDDQEDIPAAGDLKDKEIKQKTDASGPKKEDAAASEFSNLAPVSLENNESILNSPHKTKVATLLKHGTINSESQHQNECHSKASIDNHTDMTSLLEGHTRVAEPRGDVEFTLKSEAIVKKNNREPLERNKSQQRSYSERTQHPVIDLEQGVGEKAVANATIGHISPGKSKKKSRKSLEIKSPSSNVQRASKVIEESRKFRATASRKSSSPKIRSLRSSGSKGLTCLEKGKITKLKKKRITDQALNEFDCSKETESSGSTDSCSSPDLKKSDPKGWDKSDSERSFSGSSTEEQSGSISSNDATVDEDSCRELDSSLIVVDDAQGKVVSPLKKLEQVGDAEFNRDRRNMLCEMSPGSDCSVKIMFVEEGKKNMDYYVSNSVIPPGKETKETHNRPRPTFGAPAERDDNNAGRETVVNTSSFLIKSPIGSDGAPLEELTFEQNSYSQLVDSSLPGKASIKDASKEETEIVEVDSSDESRDATCKSNMHHTSDLRRDQNDNADTVFTVLISAESSKKTEREGELKCHIPKQTDTIALKEHEKSGDQPFYTELNRNSRADTSTPEPQCVLSACRAATLSLIHSPTERGKWQPVIDGDSPDQGCIFSSPVTDNDIRTQVDDILCGMALSTEKQKNIDRTPEKRKRQQKTPGNKKKCKKSLGKALALTAIREDGSANFSSAEKMEECKTSAGHEKMSKKQRKRHRDQKSLSPSQDIYRATKRSYTDVDYTQEALVAAKTDTSTTNDSNDVMVKQSVKTLTNANLPDQEWSFSLADDVNTYLDEDFKKGITMHERLKTRKRMASFKAEEGIAFAVSPKQKKAQQAPGKEETWTPKRDSVAGKRITTPKRNSVAGKRITTPKRNSVAGKRITTPKGDSVAGKRNTTPKRDSVAGKRNTTPKRDSVAGRTNITPKRDSVAEARRNTSSKTPKSKSSLNKIETINEEPVTKFDHLLSSTPTRRTRSSSITSSYADVLLVGDKRKSPAKRIHSASNRQTKVVLDEPSLYKVASENIESRDTSLSCSTEVTSTPTNYQSSRRNPTSNEQETSSKKSSDVSFSSRMTNTSCLESSRLSTSMSVALSVSNALHSGRKAKSRGSKNKEKRKEKVKTTKKRVLCGKDVNFKNHGLNDVFEYMDDPYVFTD